jgi:hypothetical protein
MLVAAENALVAGLKVHRVVQQLKLRAVDSLPKLPIDQLLARYAADAPAIYVLPGRLKGDGDDATLIFTIAGVVRNVAGNAQARKGDGIDIGCDHLMLAAVRAVHGHKLGICSWSLTAAEMVDDDIFDKSGLAAIDMTFESSRVQLPDDWELGELDQFLHFHADIDMQPFAAAGDVEYASWLAVPPDYTTDRPDADLDVTLEGAP